MQELTDELSPDAAVVYEIKTSDCNWSEPNLKLQMGEGRDSISFYINYKRIISNRVKSWLFCKFSPFTIEEWK